MKHIKKTSLFCRKALAALLFATCMLSGLTACAQSKMQTIEFVTFGAKAIAPVQEQAGTPITLPTPEWTHYQFEGWFYDAEFSSGVESDFTVPGFDLTLYASFTPMSGYRIEYLDEDGVKLLPDAYTEAGAPVTAPVAPVKSGHVLLGWFTAAGTQFSFDSAMPAEHIKLYAKWQMADDVVSVNYYGNNRLLATKYETIGSTFSAEGILDESEYNLIGGWRANSDSGEVYEFSRPLVGASKLDLHIKYRTKALEVTGSTVTGYTGTTANAAIVLDDAITQIGTFAFRNKDKIKSVEMAGAVTAIGSLAFSGCSALTKITGTDSVETVGGNAFFGCSKLTYIALPNVQEIGETAFSGCSQLESAIFGNSLEEIKAYAFQNCVRLQEIVLPDNVELGTNILDGCIALTKFTLLETVGSVPTLQSDNDGNIYSGDGTKLRFFNNTTATSFVVPDNVEEIEPTAFMKATNLTSLTLPSTLTKDGAFGALTGCQNLTSLTLHSFQEIPFLAHLYGAEMGRVEGTATSIVPTNLKTVNFSGTVTEIPDNAFFGCTGLTSIGGIQNASKIGDYAFAYTRVFTKFTVGATVTEIGNGAFAGSTVTGFDAANNDKFETDATGSYLYDKNNKRLIRLFNASATLDLGDMFEGITGLDDYALEGNTTLSSLIIPDTVKKIGNNALYGCRVLEQLEMPVQGEGAGILTNRRSFTALLGGTSVSLDSLTVNNGTGIPDGAFSAVVVKRVTLANTIETIGERAFFQCASLEQIGGLDGVVEIKENAFYGCTKLATIPFGDSLTTIGDFAFSTTGLTAVELPASTETIGLFAFAFNEKLTGFRLRDGAEASALTEIEAYAFSGCRIEGELILPAGLEYLGNAFAGNRITKVAFAGDSNSPLEVGDNAFASCKNLVSADFRGTDISILGASALAYCTALTEVLLPEGLKEIDSFTFLECSSLEDVTIPASVTRVGQRILDLTKWAENRPSGLMYKDHVAVGYKGRIRDEDFDLRLAAINPNEGMPDAGTPVTIVCKYLLWSVGTQPDPNDWIMFTYERVTSVTVPDGYTTICNFAFASLRNATTVTLGKNIEYIGEFAFGSCAKLESVTVGSAADGSALEEIDAFAFVSCNALTDVTLYSTVKAPVLHQDDKDNLTVFAQSFSYKQEGSKLIVLPVKIEGEDKPKITIHVPLSSLTLYETDEWTAILEEDVLEVVGIE